MPSHSAHALAKPAVHKTAPLPDPHVTGVETFRQIKPYLVVAQQLNSVADWVKPNHEKTGAVADTSKTISEATHSARRSRDAAYATKAAARHLSEMVQSGRDVARMKREILIVEKLVAHRGSQKAANLLPKMKTGLLVAESEWQAERTMWNSYRRIAIEYKDASASAFGKRALALEETLSKSSKGRQILDFGKVVNRGASAMETPLKVVGASVALIKGVSEAPAKTGGGKVLTGALSAGASVMMATNSVISLADFAVSSTVGEEYTLGKFYDGTAHTVGALAETLLTGDSAALGAAHKRSMEGHNGRFMQAYALIGEKISKNSIVDNMITHAAEVWTGVPKDFRTSTSWWGTADQHPVVR